MTPQLRDLIYSLLLIIIVINTPEGIYGRYRERMRRLKLQKKNKARGDKNEVSA